MRTRVVVYGSSLHMAGIAASLKADPSLEVIGLHSHAPAARQSLSELDPAAVVFDLNDQTASLDIPLLRQKLGILLIGVDPESDEILVLSSLTQQALSVSDLVHVIQKK